MTSRGVDCTMFEESEHGFSPMIRRAAASFLAMRLIPAIAFAWLSRRLLDMDRATETQRVHERLDGAAALVAAALDRRLTALQDQLPALANSPPASLPEDAVIVRFGPSRTRPNPKQRLLHTLSHRPLRTRRRAVLKRAKA
jgi:hypothetical protein